MGGITDLIDYCQGAIVLHKSMRFNLPTPYGHRLGKLRPFHCEYSSQRLNRLNRPSCGNHPVMNTLPLCATVIQSIPVQECLPEHIYGWTMV